MSRVSLSVGEDGGSSGSVDLDSVTSSGEWWLLPCELRRPTGGFPEHLK